MGFAERSTVESSHNIRWRHDRSNAGPGNGRPMGNVPLADRMNQPPHNAGEFMIATRSAGRRRLTAALALTASFMVVEAAAGLLADPDRVLSRLHYVASTEFGIAHVTIQREDSDEGCAGGHHIEHPQPVGGHHSRQ